MNDPFILIAALLINQCQDINVGLYFVLIDGLSNTIFAQFYLEIAKTFFNN